MKRIVIISGSLMIAAMLYGAVDFITSNKNGEIAKIYEDPISDEDQVNSEPAAVAEVSVSIPTTEKEQNGLVQTLENIGVEKETVIPSIVLLESVTVSEKIEPKQVVTISPVKSKIDSSPNSNLSGSASALNTPDSLTSTIKTDQKNTVKNSTDPKKGVKTKKPSEKSKEKISFNQGFSRGSLR